MATVAERLEPLIKRVFHAELPVDVQCWDGSRFGESASPVRLILRRRALRYLLWEPNELGLARAYVRGDLDVEGDLFDGLQQIEQLAQLGHVDWSLAKAALPAIARTALKLGVVGPPPRPPAQEAVLRGRRHQRQRDSQAIAYHYDISNDFYELVLGRSMTYSCAYWDPAVVTDSWDPEKLAEAQAAKFDLIARKLGLKPGMRVLDVGCGWGSFAIHAATAHGVDVVGITLSVEQARFAHERVANAGLAEHVEIRVQDYRDVADGPYDAISSIGMAEHVGAGNLPEYASTLRDLLAPRGRLLNHAISRRPGEQSTDRRRSFISRYVFPDGELVPMATMVDVLESAGWEVRDVESLREHYGLTLRAWVHNLTGNWAEAVEDAGTARARVWMLYMSSCALAFERNRVGINQILAVKPDEDGASAMPRTRTEWRVQDG